MEPSDIAGQTHSLAGLVDYQEEAVVSRTLVKKKTGTVTIFAFAQGQELSEHTVAHDALVYILDGESEITISGSPHHVKQGEILLMPGNEPHAVKATKRFKMLLTMIREP